MKPTALTNSKSNASQKIPKGFVLINLDEGQQKKMRKLANESGVALRDALRYALTRVQQDLENAALIKRKTGMSSFEWYRFAGGRPDKN